MPRIIEDINKTRREKFRRLSRHAIRINHRGCNFLWYMNLSLSMPLSLPLSPKGEFILKIDYYIPKGNLPRIDDYSSFRGMGVSATILPAFNLIIRLVPAAKSRLCVTITRVVP